MKRTSKMVMGVAAAAVIGMFAAGSAQAHSGVRFSFGFGPGYCYRPYYNCPPPVYYYAPAPVYYYAPPPPPPAYYPPPPPPGPAYYYSNGVMYRY